MQRSKPNRTHGVRGKVLEIPHQQCAILRLDGHQYRRESARLNISVFKRVMDCQVDDLDNFMNIGDRVVVVIEPNNFKGNCKWSVFDVHRDTSITRADAFPTPGSYMDMGEGRLKPPEGRSPLQTAKLFVSIRQILSVWNDLDLVSFVEIWRCKRSDTDEDSNSLRQFVDRCLAGVYCEFVGGRMRLYKGFAEDEIRCEMKRRFENAKRLEPRKREVATVVENARVVESVSDAEEILTPLVEEADKGENVVVGIDCEGYKLGRIGGSLTLLQLATMDGKVYIFDALKTPELVKEGKLKQLLEDHRVVKVMHDCRSDSAALKHLFGVKLNGVFDTSVAYSTIMEQCNKIGGPYRIGYKALCEVLGEDTSFKDDSMVGKMHNTKYWETRPLTDEMKNYAAADTATLVPHVYKAIDGMINSFWRDYFHDKCKAALSEFSGLSELWRI